MIKICNSEQITYVKRHNKLKLNKIVPLVETKVPEAVRKSFSTASLKEEEIMSSAAIYRSGKNSKINELEGYIKRYSDMPREVIVKEDVLRNGIQFSEAVLESSGSYQTKSYYLFSTDRVKIEDMTKKEFLRAPEEIRLVKGPYDLRPTVVASRISADSPYLVDKIDGKFVLKADGHIVSEVVLRDRPAYYDDVLSDGTPCSEIAPSTSWGNTVFVTILRACGYWGDKEECKYCDINHNYRQNKQAGRQMCGHKKPEQIREALKIVFGKKYDGAGRTCLLSGGTVIKKVDGKDDFSFYQDYVMAARDAIGGRWPVELQGAAKDKETFKLMKAAGVDVFHPNIEVWDKKLFEIICPGKDRFIGRDEWIKRTVEAVDVFGEGNVTPAFVAGVEMAQPWGFKTVSEAVKSTAEGWDFLMKNGVVPRLFQWVVEPFSYLGGQEPPPLEFQLENIRSWYETWKRYRLPLPRGKGQMGPGVATNCNSAYLDMGPV